VVPTLQLWIQLELASLICRSLKWEQNSNWSSIIVNCTKALNLSGVRTEKSYNFRNYFLLTKFVEIEEMKLFVLMIEKHWQVSRIVTHCSGCLANIAAVARDMVSVHQTLARPLCIATPQSSHCEFLLLKNIWIIKFLFGMFQNWNCYIANQSVISETKTW